jgi:UDP-3-O-[3-hydroxymyristoyl] glucosamine N-acyltransferase
MLAETAQYSLQQLAEFLHADLVIPPGCRAVPVSGLAALQTAQAGQLGFLSKPSFAKHLHTTKASVVIVGESLQTTAAVPLLRVKNPYLAYAQVSALFDNRPACVSGIHVSAVVDPTALIAATATIGAHVVIEANVRVGAHTVIHAGSVIGANTIIGEHCQINRNVTIYHNIVLGDRVSVHSAAVIGADGFGFAPKPGGGWQKIHQLGSVRIGSDVEIGANTTIDRGAIEDTVIEDGAIIDNQVQIAHNVHIGKNTAIAACTGIAGSTKIGANCTIAGAVGIVGHLTIADNVHITAMSLVTGSIREAGSYSGGTALSATTEWRRNAVRFNQLDSIARRLNELEKK